MAPGAGERPRKVEREDAMLFSGLVGDGVDVKRWMSRVNGSVRV